MIVENGTHDDLMGKGGVYYTLVTNQVSLQNECQLNSLIFRAKMRGKN